MAVMRALLGVLTLCLVAWAISDNRRKIPWRTILVGITIQILLAAFILKTAPGIWIFAQLTALVAKLLEMTNDGTALVFGPLNDQVKTGFVLAIQLCTIIFFSAL